MIVEPSYLRNRRNLWMVSLYTLQGSGDQGFQPLGSFRPGFKDDFVQRLENGIVLEWFLVSNRLNENTTKGKNI